jgi:hypothetical protein
MQTGSSRSEYEAGYTRGSLRSVRLGTWNIQQALVELTVSSVVSTVPVPSGIAPGSWAIRKMRSSHLDEKNLNLNMSTLTHLGRSAPQHDIDGQI